MSTTWTIGKRSARAACTTGTETAPANPVKASGTAAFSTIVAGNKVTIGGVDFVAGSDFALGANDTDAAANCAAAINAKHSRVSATASTGTVTITALEYGVGGNAITLARTGTPITVSGSVLASGVDLVGASMVDVETVQIFIEAPAAATVAGGTLKAYVFNELSGLWATFPGLDLTVPAGAARTAGILVNQAIVGRGRIAYLPSGVTAASGATVYHNCYDASGRLLS